MPKFGAEVMLCRFVSFDVSEDLLSSNVDLASGGVGFFCLVFKELDLSLGFRMLILPVGIRIMAWPLMAWMGWLERREVVIIFGRQGRVGSSLT